MPLRSRRSRRRMRWPDSCASSFQNTRDLGGRGAWWKSSHGGIVPSSRTTSTNTDMAWDMYHVRERRAVLACKQEG